MIYLTAILLTAIDIVGACYLFPNPNCPLWCKIIFAIYFLCGGWSVKNKTSERGNDT